MTDETNQDEQGVPAEPTEQPTAAVDDTGEQPEKAPPEVENFAGGYEPTPNVSEDLPILEEISEETISLMAKQGEILLSNMSTEDLQKISQAFSRQIGEQQPSRRRMINEGVAHKYQSITMPNRQVLHLTVDEASVLSLINDYVASLRYPYGEDLFTGDEWTNKPTKGDKVIVIGRQRAEKSKDPVLRILGKVGLNNRHNIPLWHTGMHLRIESAGSLRALLLEQQILLEKVNKGRQSNAYVFSASAVYMNQPVMEFVLDQVVSTSAGSISREELLNLIRITDIEPLCTGAAQAQWPDGYLLDRPCLTSSGGCGHVVQRKVNINRMLVVRHKRITEEQKNVMVKEAGPVDTSIIRAYQEQMRPEVSRLIPLGNGSFLKMWVPSLAAYFRIAGAWMAKLDTQARELATSNATGDQREEMLERASVVALIMAYGHWIEAVLEQNEDDSTQFDTAFSRVIDDPEDLEQQYKADEKMDFFLTRLSEDPEITDRVIKALRKFMDDMTVAVTVVPKVICPNCQKPVTGDESSKHPSLVQVNAVELFFTLLRLRIRNAGG